MKRLLVNDGIHPSGKKMLEDAGFEVETNHVPQEELNQVLSSYDGIIVRSATQVRKELIDECPSLKVIARGGVGLDNIDVAYALSKGIEVINTPQASSTSVAELVFGHVLSLARSLHLSNQMMPEHGNRDFKKLKKSYSKGIEIKGKKMGIIGLGRIGRETARIAIGIGMDVLAVDPMVSETDIVVSEKHGFTVRIETCDMATLLQQSDVISLHVPFTGTPVLGSSEFEQMKQDVILINASRGGTVDESALIEAIESEKVFAAGLDVFANEPAPNKELLEHNSISVSPHIGASTVQAQENIGIELAEKIIRHFNGSI